MTIIGLASIIACLIFVTVAVSFDTGVSGSASFSDPTVTRIPPVPTIVSFRSSEWIDHKYRSDDRIFGDSLSVSTWGTYQPDKYFAMKTRSTPFYLQSGIFWKSTSDSFRFSVREDELTMMRFDVHDGKSYGRESLVDLTNNMNISASFAIPDIDYDLNADTDVPSPTLIQSFHVSPISSTRSGSSQTNNAYLYYYFGGSVYPETGIEESGAAKQLNSHNNAIESSEHGEYSLLQVSSLTELFRHSCLEAKEQEQEDDNSADSCSFDGNMDDVAGGPNNPLFAIGKSDISGWFLLLFTTTSRNSELSFWCPGKMYANSVPTTMEILSHAHKHHTLSSGDDTADDKRDKKNPWFDYLTPAGHLRNVLDSTCTHTLFVQMKQTDDSNSVMDVQLFDHLRADSVEDVQVLLQQMMTEMKSKSTISSTVDSGSKMKKINSYFESKFHDRFATVFGSTNNEPSTAFMGKEGLALVEGHCKKIVSDLLGGVGFWVGVPETRDSRELEQDASISQTAGTCSPVTLHCSSPSRTSFPRGFLWDEGFHQMLMSLWDPQLSLGIIDSWLSAQYNTEFYNAEDQVQQDIENSPETVGFIPREMILGQESRAKVPGEFIPQFVDVANPPTLLLAIQSIIAHNLGDIEVEIQQANEGSGSSGTASLTAEQQAIVRSLAVMYPKLHSWVQWFIHSQQGRVGSHTFYRWKGRMHTNDHSERLLTNTLASGLDDYPRAEIASEVEEHVDLLSWMVASCRTMQRVISLLKAYSNSDADNNNNHGGALHLQLTKHAELYKTQEIKLSSRLFDDRHWSSTLQAYVDTGLHDLKGSRKSNYIVNKVVVKCSTVTKDSSIEALAGMERRGGQWALKEECPPSHPVLLFPLGDGKGGYLMREEIVPSKQYKKALKGYRSALGTKGSSNGFNKEKDLDVLDAALDKVINQIPRLGYVSLFPFLLKLIPVSGRDAELSAILGHIGNSSELWSDFGIRSLSKTDLFYNKGNAPYDSPYWRAPIWMPINYLVLDALRYYANKLSVENPNQALCEELYRNLRLNLINNVLIREYTRSGYLWEHYNDESGDGMRGHPFNGWTSLIVNVVYEKFIDV